MDDTFWQEWRQELRTFSRDTTARLQAHEEWKQRHDETMQEMRAERQVMLQTHERQMASLNAIMERLAAAFINHEARLSQHERTMQEITTTLQAIRNSL
jgi:hypothetical protein